MGNEIGLIFCLVSMTIASSMAGWLTLGRTGNNAPNLPPTHLLQLVTEGLHSKAARINRPQSVNRKTPSKRIIVANNV